MRGEQNTTLSRYQFECGKEALETSEERPFENVFRIVESGIIAAVEESSTKSQSDDGTEDERKKNRAILLTAGFEGWRASDRLSPTGADSAEGRSTVPQSSDATARTRLRLTGCVKQKNS